MRRGGGVQPRPGIPALALGARPGGADLPAAGVLAQRAGGLRAGHRLPAAGQDQVKGGPDPQHVPLAAVLAELPQLGAVAVHLVAAHEVEPHSVSEPVGAQADGQLPLGAEHQIRWQPHDRRPRPVPPLPGPVPPPPPLPATPWSRRLRPAGAGPCLPGPVPSTPPTPRPRRRPDRAAASSRPATANRRTTPIAPQVSHTARLSSRCVLSGLRSPACSAIVHPFRLASPLATALTYFRACSHGSTRAKHTCSSPASSTRFCWPSPAPILTAAAASGFVVLTST